MKPKSLLLLFVAGACGLIAAVFTAQHLAGSQAPLPQLPTVEKRSVVIAVKEIPAGTQLKEDMVKVIELPTKDLPDGTYTATAEITGQIVRFPVFKGEPVLAGKLGRSFSISDGLAPGMKAYTVKVADEDKPMTGLINPTDHVDVYWLQMQSDLQGTSVRLLLQNVRVLAVGQRTESEESESGNRDPRGHLTDNYTLEVTPRQHQRLQAALIRGKVRLALRGRSDTSVEDLDERTLDMLLNLIARPVEKPPVVSDPVPATEQWEVEYVKGNESLKEVLNIAEERRLKLTNPKPN